MKKFFYTLALLFVLLPAFALAAEFKTSQSGAVSVGKNETAKNLYTAGQSVSIDGNVSKDLVAAGTSVSINGNVENSVFAAGTTVTVNGNVGDNVRLAGSTLQINGSIGSDLLAGGSTIVLDRDSQIGGDLIAAGSTLNINGNVLGNARISGSNIVITGTIEGDVIAKNVSNLTLADGSLIKGKLTYSSPNEVTIEGNAKVNNGIDYTKISSRSKTEFAKSINLSRTLYKILGTFVFLLILIYLLPKLGSKLVNSAYEKFGSNLGIGLLALIVTPIAFFILLALLLTAGVAVAMILFYILLLIVSTIAAALLIGSGLSRLYKKSNHFEVNWISALIGSIVVGLISLLPVFGSLILFVFLLVAFGALLRLNLECIRAERK